MPVLRSQELQHLGKKQQRPPSPNQHPLPKLASAVDFAKSLRRALHARICGEKVPGGLVAWGPPPRNVLGAADKVVNQTQGVLSHFKSKKHF